MRCGLLQMSCQNSGSHTGPLCGVCWAGQTLTCAGLGEWKDGLSVTQVWKKEFEGGVLAQHGAFHGCLLEKQQFVSPPLPLQLSVLPSSIATMVFCDGGRKGERKKGC